MKRLSLLTILALALVLGACEDTKGDLYGVIRDGRRLTPLAEVELTLRSRQDGSEVSTTSDESGSYRFAGVDRGPFELIADREGYTQASRFGEVIGGRSVELNLTLTPIAEAHEALVTVAVRDALTGRAIEGARIDLYVGPTPSGVAYQSTETTDATGVIEFDVPALSLNAVRYIHLEGAARGYLNDSLDFNITYDRPTASVVMTMTPV